jgi:hypothetical protein
MKVSKKSIIQGLLFTAPIALSSTIALSPTYAASVAGTSGSLVLENFNRVGKNPFSDATTFTDAVSSPGSFAEAEAPSDALVTLNPAKIDQFSIAGARGFGNAYFANAKSTSDTGLEFNTRCGCFQFDFSAALAAIAQATAPGEKASASSFVAFYIFNSHDLNNPIDFLEASLSSDNPFNLVRSSDFIQVDSVSDLGSGEAFALDGSYARQFGKGTQLTVRGVTRSEAVATVPEPPMFAALVILPGLMWLKRRSKMKPLPQELAK